MPVPPLVPSVYQVTTYGTLNDLPCDHVINYYVSGTLDSPASIATRLAGYDKLAWVPSFTASLPPFYTHTSSRCVYLGDTTSAPGETTVGAVGTATPAFGPHNTCATVRHAVSVRGRGKQGRTNIPGPPVSYVDGTSGHINDTGLAAYGEAWAAYQSYMQTHFATDTGGGLQLIVLDRKLGTYNFPHESFVDVLPNVHRRWQKRLSRHR